MGQAQDLLVNDPVPDIVFIQSIDNDLQCDGSDAQNLPAFKSRVADVMTFLQQNIPGVKLYFDDQAVRCPRLRRGPRPSPRRPVPPRHRRRLQRREGRQARPSGRGPAAEAGRPVLRPAGEHLQLRLRTAPPTTAHCRPWRSPTPTSALDMDHFTVSGLAKVAADRLGHHACGLEERLAARHASAVARNAVRQETHTSECPSSRPGHCRRHMHGRTTRGGRSGRGTTFQFCAVFSVRACEKTAQMAVVLVALVLAGVAMWLALDNADIRNTSRGEKWACAPGAMGHGAAGCQQPPRR